MNKIRLVVICGNMLGYILPATPFHAGILGISVARGGGYWFPNDGPYPLRLDGTDVRPATLADFETFRVTANGYRNDPAYEPIPA
jgi:hypothetical protein